MWSARGLYLSLRAARLLIFAADDVKFHEVCGAADKQRSPGHDSDDIPGLDQMFFEQPFFGDQDELLDVVHLGDRSRHHAPIEREPPPRFLDGRKGDNGTTRAMF